MEKVSVVLATYNGEKYIEEQLGSILAQDYAIDEIIISDDSSSDSTLSIVSRLSSLHPGLIKIHINKIQLGPTENFRKGVSLCKNDNYIALADQDDVWLQQKISLQMQAIVQAEKEMGVGPILVFHDLELMDAAGHVFQRSFWQYFGFSPAQSGLKEILVGNVVTGCTCLLNPTMRIEFEKMDSKKVMLHDHWLACLGYGVYNYIAIEAPLIKYRDHSVSVTSKTKKSLIDTMLGHVRELASGNPEYLSENIRQAKQLKSMYYVVMPKVNKRILDKFIALEAHSYLVKKLRLTYRTV